MQQKWFSFTLMANIKEQTLLNLRQRERKQIIERMKERKEGRKNERKKESRIKK